MIGEGIHEEVLRALVEQHAVRECLLARIDGGPYWGLSIRMGRQRRTLSVGALAS